MEEDQEEPRKSRVELLSRVAEAIRGVAPPLLLLLTKITLSRPSEKLDTPLLKDNALYRFIQPRLKTVGLERVNFQVMRRTYSSLMREMDVDPKVVADLTGHDVNVNLNTYTQTSIETKLEAVEVLESAFVN